VQQTPLSQFVMKDSFSRWAAANVAHADKQDFEFRVVHKRDRGWFIDWLTG
jgi:hypothetical protein